jgi:hypothetical protein
MVVLPLLLLPSSGVQQQAGWPGTSWLLASLIAAAVLTTAVQAAHFDERKRWMWHNIR